MSFTALILWSIYRLVYGSFRYLLVGSWFRQVKSIRCSDINWPLPFRDSRSLKPVSPFLRLFNLSTSSAGLFLFWGLSLDFEARTAPSRQEEWTDDQEDFSISEASASSLTAETFKSADLTFAISIFYSLACSADLVDGMPIFEAEIIIARNCWKNTSSSTFFAFRQMRRRISTNSYVWSSTYRFHRFGIILYKILL